MIIAQKINKLLANASFIRKMFEEGEKLRRQYGEENVYDFSLGNPNFPAPPAVKRAILEILEEEESTFVHGYMSNTGFEDVRAAVAADLNARFGAAFTAGNIVMTVGAAGGMNVILKTLLNPEDEVLVSSPYFVDYGNYVRNYDGVLRAVPSLPGSFLPDAEAIAAAVNPRTKAVSSTTPTTPPASSTTQRRFGSGRSAGPETERAGHLRIPPEMDEPYRELTYDGPRCHGCRNTTATPWWAIPGPSPCPRPGAHRLSGHPVGHEYELISAMPPRRPACWAM